MVLCIWTILTCGLLKRLKCLLIYSFSRYLLMVSCVLGLKSFVEVMTVNVFCYVISSKASNLVNLWFFYLYKKKLYHVIRKHLLSSKLLWLLWFHSSCNVIVFCFYSLVSLTCVESIILIKKCRCMAGFLICLRMFTGLWAVKVY